MINLNFYYDKDYFLKKNETLLWLVTLIFFFQLSASAQNSREELYAEKLTKEIASAQQQASFLVYGKYFTVNKSINEAETKHFTNKTIYSFSFSKSNLQIQALLYKVNLGFSDSIIITDGETAVQTITNQNLAQNILLSEPVKENLTLNLIWRSHTTPTLQISELLLAPIKKELTKTEDFGDSQTCQVNTSCSEGDDYRKEIKSTVRILVRVDNIVGWCTGSLLNNVQYDYQPLLLSAEHCALFNGQFASTTDLQSWVFYFNYEAPNCTNPTNEGTLGSQSLVGAELLAQSDDDGGETGSDLLLLKLSSDIPAEYEPYFTGWNRNGDIRPLNSIGIHHPGGDIKKISTSSGSASNGAFGSTANGTHWLVSWTQTENGYGTTEGGSSGSPLLDEDGLLRGVLTGGASSCTNTDGLDYYGKFSYSWDQNGSDPNRQLQPWLDPENTGTTVLPGAFLGDEKPKDTTTFAYFPNPTTDMVTFEGLGSFTQSCQVDILYANGKIINTFQKNVLPNEDLILSFSAYKQGLYIVRIQQGEQIYTRRVIKLN